MPRMMRGGKAFEKLICNNVTADNIIAESITNTANYLIANSGISSSTIPDDSDTLIDFTAGDNTTDSGGESPPTLSTDTITITTPGIYSLSADVQWDNDATGYRSVTFSDGNSTRQLGDAIGPLNISISTIARYSTGDTINVVVFQNSGGDLDAGVSIRVVQLCSTPEVPPPEPK